MMKRSRACLDCGTDITQRHHNAVRCIPCAATREHSKNGSTNSVAACVVGDEDCRPGPVTRGYCRRHYARVKSNGSPYRSKPDLYSMYVVTSTECWEWTGVRSTGGYGRTPASITGRSLQAHRVFYEHLVAPIPDGQVLDHLCRNPPCVNPEHLEPVSQQENIQRGWDAVLAGKCRKGLHDLLEDSDWWVSPSTGNRQCRECWRTRYRANKRAQRARERAARQPKAE